MCIAAGAALKVLSPEYLEQMIEPPGPASACFPWAFK
jgi:hypothetical protein